jgi:hypothetical protein
MVRRRRSAGLPADIHADVRQCKWAFNDSLFLHLPRPKNVLPQLQSHFPAQMQISPGFEPGQTNQQSESDSELFLNHRPLYF